QKVIFGPCGLSLLLLRSLWFQFEHFRPCGFNFKQFKDNSQFLLNFFNYRYL
ncbi:unnamed protein product, partial [Prunus brigantina]